MASTLDMIEIERVEPELSFAPADIVSTYRFLLSSSGCSVSSFLSCARAFESLGMDEEALDAYDRTIARDGLCWEAYLGRGEILIGMFVKHEDESGTSDLGVRAVRDFEMALSLAGSSHGEIFRAFVIALLLVGDCGRCQRSIESWLLQGHEHEGEMRSDLLYVLGFARLFSGEAEKSIEAFVEMARLGVLVEDSLFGRLVCLHVMKRDDLVKEMRSELGPQFSAALSILEERGCDRFLEVARALLSMAPAGAG